MGKKIKSTKKTQQISTKTAAWLQVYSITMLVVMTLIGCILFDVIAAKDDDRNSDVNSIIEITNKDELTDIMDKQGSYDVMICGKASTYSPIKHENVGNSLLYIKTITYDDSGETEETDRVEFIRIYGSSFSTKSMMFLEPNIVTNAIKNDKKIEYQAVTSKSDVVIHGRIENGVLQQHAKVYTNISSSELKQSMNIDTTGREFFIIWEIMVLVFTIVPVIYILIKRSTPVRNYHKKVFPETKEYLRTVNRPRENHTSQYDYRTQYNSNKQSYKRKEPYRNNERKK